MSSNKLTNLELFGYNPKKEVLKERKDKYSLNKRFTPNKNKDNNHDQVKIRNKKKDLKLIKSVVVVGPVENSVKLEKPSKVSQLYEEFGKGNIDIVKNILDNVHDVSDLKLSQYNLEELLEKIAVSDFYCKNCHAIGHGKQCYNKNSDVKWQAFSMLYNKLNDYNKKNVCWKFRFSDSIITIDVTQEKYVETLLSMIIEVVTSKDYILPKISYSGITIAYLSSIIHPGDIPGCCNLLAEHVDLDSALLNSISGETANFNKLKDLVIYYRVIRQKLLKKYFYNDIVNIILSYSI